MDYKIYRNDNYIFIDEVAPGTKRYSGLCSEVTVDNSPAASDVFTIRGVRGFAETLNLAQIKKEAGMAYTNAEFVDFYTQNTGQSPDASGGSGGNVVVTSSALPTGAATSAKQDSQTNILTDIEANQSAQATAALQTIGNTSIASIDTKTPTVGQKTMAVSSPVVIASNQSSIPVNNNDGSGNALSSTTNVAGNRGLNTTQQGTLFDFSTVNSTSAQLAAGATFTGAIESVANQQAYSILFFSDQSAIITVKQYSDAAGLKLASSIPISYTANQPFASSRVLNGNYAQVLVQNTSGSTTTTLRLDTAYGEIPSATQLNNLPVSLEEVAGTAFSLGQKASAASLPVVISSDQILDLSITGQATQTAAGQNIILATAGTGVTDCLGYRSVAVQVIPTGTVSSGVVTFEASNDPAFATVNAVSLWLYDDNNQTSNPVTSVSPATGVTRSLSGPIKYRYIRARISTVIGGGGSLQAITILRQMTYQPHVYAVTQATAASLNTTSTISSITPGITATSLGKAEDAAHVTGDTGVAVFGIRNDIQTTTTNASGDYNLISLDQYGNTISRKYGTQKRTYSAAFQVVLAATATDVVEIVGSATTSVQITKVTIGGTQTTGGGVVVNLIKRSTAATGGTSTTATLIAHESADTGATAVVKVYTANPTTGTLVGNIKSRRVQLGATTSVSPAAEFEWAENSKPVILAGVAQTLCVNLGGVTATGGTLDVEIEFTEI